MADRKRKSPRKNTAQLTVSGSNLRLEQPSSGRKSRPTVARVVVQEVNPVGGFLEFLRAHAVVTLAVGFAIATQAQTLIKQLIASFIDPLYGLLFSQKLSAKALTLHFHGRTQAFGWGAFVYAFVDFLFVLAAIYAIVKLLNLDKLEQSKEAELEVKD
jgi:large-conductance mechanosensitive channel